jgi:hypothetical protein
VHIFATQKITVDHPQDGTLKEGYFDKNQIKQRVGGVTKTAGYSNGKAINRMATIVKVGKKKAQKIMRANKKRKS